MKKYLLICLMILSSFVQISAAGAGESDDQIRDSLFKVLNTMPQDTLRAQKAIDIYYEYSKYSFAAGIAEFLLNDAKVVGDGRYLATAYYTLLNNYSDKNDLQGMKGLLPLLKEACSKSGNYKQYFRGWNLILNQYLTEGEYELVAIEGKKMKEEAEKLEYDDGIIVANISLCGMYKRIHKLDTAIVLYKEIINLPKVSFKEKLTAILNLSATYGLKQDFNSAIVWAQRGKKYMDDYVVEKKMPRMQNRSNYLTIELLFCNIYLSIDDAIHLKQHTDSARVYMPEVLSDREYVLYHSHLASYHNLMGHYQEALSELDNVLSKTDFLGNTEYINYTYWKTVIYWNMNEKAKSLAVLDSVISMESSMHEELLDLQEMTIANNYRMEKAQLRSASLRVIFGYTVAIIAASILIVLVVFFLRNLALLRKEKRNHVEANHAYQLAEQANKMKESFVKNISFEIRSSLGPVIGYSNVLSSSSDLSKDEILQYSKIIKTNADNLTNLINDVLTLSRMEAGMMKYQMERYDIIALCLECNIPFESDLKSAYKKIDKSRMVQILQTSMSPESKLSISKESHQVVLSITSSPLAFLSSQADNITELNIKQEINKQIMKQFGGQYIPNPETGEISCIL